MLVFALFFILVPTEQEALWKNPKIIYWVTLLKKQDRCSETGQRGENSSVCVYTSLHVCENMCMCVTYVKVWTLEIWITSQLNFYVQTSWLKRTGQMLYLQSKNYLIWGRQQFYSQTCGPKSFLLLHLAGFCKGSRGHRCEQRKNSHRRIGQLSVKCCLNNQKTWYVFM